MNYQKKNKTVFVAQVKCLGKKIILVSLFSIYLANAIAQHSSPDTIRAIAADKINFDGKLTEPVWLTAPAINNFTQREHDFCKTSNRSN